MSKPQANNGHIAEALLSLVMPIDSVQPDPRNVRRHPDPNMAAIKRSLETYGQRKPIVVNNTTGHIEAGNGLWAAAKALGWTEIAVVKVQDDETTAKAFGVMDNRSAELAEWDLVALKDLLQELDTGAFPIELTGFDEAALEELVNQCFVPLLPDKEQARRTLADRFIIPPFSVLDARQGYWQERKRAWVALGIKSELGRGNDNLGMSHPETTSTIDFYAQKRKIEQTLGRELNKDEAAEMMAERGTLQNDREANRLRKQERGLLDFSEQALTKYDGKGQARTFGQDLMKGENPNFGQGKASKTAQPQSGTSIFDPVLCEIAYRWFCPPQGHVLDPFAGGSVRGIVAGYLGYSYTGVELRPEQVAANREQSIEIVLDKPVVWIIGDSQHVKELAFGEYDLIFSCPPYYDLEVYSDRPGELSAMSPEGFKAAYQQIIKESCAMLKENRFAVWVVGDVRDKKGYYRNFVADTIAAFQAAGLRLYNEAILVTIVGSLPIRVIHQFEAGRKLGKTHQNVLVFVKGDSKKAVEACGSVKVDWQPEDNGDNVVEELPHLD